MRTNILTFYMLADLMNLQLFASGAVVHGTESYVNANTPASSEAYVATAGSESGLSAEMKTFYDKTLIALAGPNLVFDQLGQKRPIPKNGGKTIEFRRFNSLPKATSPITEGVTPTGSKLTVVPITATVDQYGDYVELTDVLEMTSIDPIIVEATKQLSDQAGRTIDTVSRNEVVGGTNVNYVPSVASDGTETAITSRYTLTTAAKLRVKDVFKAAAQLKAMNAPMKDGSYVAVIHPYAAFDLMQDAEGKWVDIQKYADPSKILKGEIGTVGGVRFVQTSEAPILTGDDLASDSRTLLVNGAHSTTTATSITFDGGTVAAHALIGRKILVGTRQYTVTENTTTAITISGTIGVAISDDVVIYPGEGAAAGIAVFATMFFGENAFGTTDIAGGGIQHILKPLGSGNDPLNQRSSVGWKATKVACRLVEEYMLRVESCSSFSTATLEAN